MKPVVVCGGQVYDTVAEFVAALVNTVTETEHLLVIFVLLTTEEELLNRVVCAFNAFNGVSGPFELTEAEDFTVTGRAQ